MAQARKSRSWWTVTVSRWRRSGQTAASRLGRGTRAEHGPSIEPIEITVPTGAMGSSIEVAVGDAVIRCEPGADVTYIAALVRALSGR